VGARVHTKMRVCPSSFRVLTAVLVVALTLGGCGDDAPAGNGVGAKTPAQIVAAAQLAAAGAATVHVAGSIVNGGKPISLDMELISGKGGQGRVALDGVSVELLAVDRGGYLNGSAAFFRHVLGPVGEQLGGRWLKAPAHRGNFSWIKSLTSLRDLVAAALATHGSLSRAPGKTLAGEPAVAVTDGASGGTLYVAATGDPYPLELVTPRGTLVFDRWNRPVTLTAPATAVNISRLQPHR